VSSGEYCALESFVDFGTIHIICLFTSYACPLVLFYSFLWLPLHSGAGHYVLLLWFIYLLLLHAVGSVLVLSVTFFTHSFFCLCINYLGNCWTDLHQIHKEDIFDTSLRWVSVSRLKVNVNRDKKCSVYSHHPQQRQNGPICYSKRVTMHCQGGRLRVVCLVKHLCCSLLFFFHAVISQAEERRPVRPFPGCQNMVWFYNVDQRGANFAPIFHQLGILKPYNFGIAQDIAYLKHWLETTFIMVALCNRADHYLYFCPVISIFFLSFFSRLISLVGDWMSTILPHMVWP